MKIPGDLGALLEQAQQMQQNIANLQAELEQKTVQASAGGGMVTATVSGGMKLVQLSIEKTVVDPSDVDMLQDLVTAAVNEALRKAKEMMKEEMAKLTGGLPIPGMS
ncbi:MAG: YbaB/EbfC family nucleoid-associated protein [Bdellovibrionales bacterium]|nr:YbaB/EbfC family nucleoid-associated protein [Bdellovibrionales bacterium]